MEVCMKNLYVKMLMTLTAGLAQREKATRRATNREERWKEKSQNITVPFHAMPLKLSWLMRRRRFGSEPGRLDVDEPGRPDVPGL